MPQRQGRRTGVALFGATLLLLSGAAAYVATQRPDLLARLRAGGAETAADEPAGPTAEPQPPPSVTEPASQPQPSASSSSAASDTDGFLTVMCEPECAVEVDDQPVGPAPVFERALAVGKHKVTLSRPGYQSKTVRVDLRAGERETLKITMDVPIRPPPPLDDDPY
jgi:serine/threonine-protein kinase